MKIFRGIKNSVKLAKILLHFRSKKEKYFTFFLKITSIFSFLKTKFNSFIFQVKSNPQKYIIILLSIFCFLFFIGYMKEAIDWDSFSKPKPATYTLSLKKEKFLYKSEHHGKIKQNKIPPKLPHFFSKGEVLLILDTTDIDGKITQIGHDFPKIKGDKVVISDEIIESPNQSELIKTQMLINQVETKISLLIKELEAAEINLDKAKQLYAQEVVTKAYLESAENKYQIVLSQLTLAESELSDLKVLYNQQSILNKRKRIIIRSQEERKDTTFLDKWVNEKNKEIKDLLDQKEKANIKAHQDILITHSFVKGNQTIKKGDNLFEYQKLEKYGYINLKEKDRVSLLKRKARVYYIHSGNKVLLSHWLIVNDKLQIDLKLNNIKGRTKIIIERVNDE